MSFVLPTTVTIVDKYCTRPLSQFQGSLPVFPKEEISNSKTIWSVISKYNSFKELTKIARMEEIFNDSQTKITIFIPLDLLLPKTILKVCNENIVQEKEILNVKFETARTMINSLIIPSALSTTMMMQSAFTRYKTRNLVNTLTVQTSHCVQFEPQTYNKPPFGIILNGMSRILTPDILTSNGIVHTIDKFPYSA